MTYREQVRRYDGVVVAIFLVLLAVELSVNYYVAFNAETEEVP